MGVILTTYPPSPGMNPPSSSKSVGGAKKEETVCCRAEGMKNLFMYLHDAFIDHSLAILCDHCGMVK